MHRYQFVPVPPEAIDVQKARRIVYEAGACSPKVGKLKIRVPGGGYRNCPNGLVTVSFAASDKARALDAGERMGLAVERRPA